MDADKKNRFLKFAQTFQINFQLLLGQYAYFLRNQY